MNSQKMRATQYEGSKTFSVVEKNVVPPSTGEVQIKVAFCGVCGTDMHIYHGNMDQRVKMPITIGHEMSGTIESIGKDVSGFKRGDKVVVRPLDNRGEKPSDKGYSHICEDLKFIGIDSPGAMQQYWNVPSFVVHKLPEDSDLRLCALVEPLAVACHVVRLSELKEGEHAVVLGGGPIGILVAMVAKHAGAKIIVSEVNDARVALIIDLGFTAINPTSEDLVKFVRESTLDARADVVYEVAGVQSTIDLITDLAGIRGRIVIVAIHNKLREVDLFKLFWKELKLIGTRVYEKEDYDKAISLISEKKIHFEKLITTIEPLTNIQTVFEGIESNPSGIKVLLDCQN